MKIFRPIFTNGKSQGFGANNPYCKLNENGTPVRPYVIQGSIPLGEEKYWTKFYPTMGLKGHNGEDWRAWNGEPLYFPVDCPQAGGWHSIDASDSDGGLGVDVVSNNAVTLGEETSYLKFRFWHLERTWKDQDVQFGEIIGYCDNTGASSGSHLHWCMKRCDKDGNSLYPNNGYNGAEDFTPYFENTFIFDEIKRRNDGKVIEDQIREVQLTLIEKLKQYVTMLSIQIQKLSTGK